MKIPQNQYIRRQCFHSKFIEHVWWFPLNNVNKEQIIFKIYKTGKFYLEGGKINNTGDYINSFDDDVPDYFTKKNLELNEVLKYIKKEELEEVIKETINYLK